MTASVSITVNQFLELSQLYEEKDSVFSVVGCAYLIKNKKATPSKKNHCGNPTHEDTVKTAKIYLEGLYSILCEDSECSPKGAGIDFNHILEELVKYFLCKGRHRGKDNQANLIKQWSEELSAYKKRCQLREQLKLYLVNLNNTPSQIPDDLGLRAPNSDNLNTTPKRATAKFPKSLPSTPVPRAKAEFEPYSQGTPEGEEGDRVIARALNSVLERRLKGKQLKGKTGWVYLIAHPQEQNMFKVGQTTDPEKRLKAHQKCLGNNIAYRAKEEIKFYRRIEQVIFIELARERRKLKYECDICDKRHKEWVNTREDKIMNVFNRWVKFARKDPYDENGSLRDGLKLPPPAGIFIYQDHDIKESRRKSDIGLTKPVERSLLGEFKKNHRSRHSDVHLSSQSQSKSSSDGSDIVAISERFAQLTIGEVVCLSDDTSDSEESDSD